jgi:hypothetical protein
VRLGHSLRFASRCAALASLLWAVPPAASAADQQTFATPEAAIAALSAALKANDERALVAIFGERHKALVVTGDAASDKARWAEASALLSRYLTLDDSVPDRRLLLIGEHAWPLPIPLVRERGAWRFASEQGFEEVLNRRIGANERQAVGVLRAYVDAQREYASRDRNGDGVLEYAGKLISSAGKLDGLYWPADESKGEEASPFGPLIGRSASYLAGHKRGDPYRGYHFRILTRQGKAAAGGPYNYVINGRLIAGFAMVAYPDVHGQSGVMTFVVNQNGRVFEKDLGKNTAAVAAGMQSFDPGPGWAEAPL